MNIVVLNGSPKGDLSVTLQYVRYAAKTFPQHSFTLLSVAQNIRKLEKDEAAFNNIMDAVRGADAVLWAFPLYYLVVCAQYKRFIELIFARNQLHVFQEKYTASLSTSIHVFDHTAHNYIHAICDDLHMNYVGAYSAAMYDLLKEPERKRWLLFAEQFLSAVSRRIPTAPVYPPLMPATFRYEPGTAKATIDGSGKRILVMTDGQEPAGNVQALVSSLTGNFRGELEVVSLADIDIKGGCLGCCKCGLDNVCAYEGKDGYIDFFNAKVRTADVIVFAGAIQDRYLSADWKTFFDRSFFNTHIPTLTGKQIAFLIAGPLGQIPNLRQILEAYVELQQADLVGIITDEPGDSPKIDLLLTELAGALMRPVVEGCARPVTFLSVGVRKIFRDEVYGALRFVFQADHRYYQSHGMYDFPQKNLKTRCLNLIMMLLTKLPPFRQKFPQMIKDEMVKPLRKIVESKDN